MIKYSEETGKRVRQVREHFGVSRPKMAKYMGVPATTFKNYELNYRNCSPEFLFTFVNDLTHTPEIFKTMFQWLMGVPGVEFNLEVLVYPKALRDIKV